MRGNVPHCEILVHLRQRLDNEENQIIKTISEANPGFLTGCTNLNGGVAKYYSANFAENCMEMKKVGPEGEGACPKFYYVDLPLYLIL